jgi:hypothetical protein
MHINPDVLSNVIESALAEVEGDTRWTNAITKAAKLVEEDCFLPTANGSILVFSDSGNEYNTSENDCRTGDTPCPAFHRGLPCKHRALLRLVTLLEEAESATNH